MMDSDSKNRPESAQYHTRQTNEPYAHAVSRKTPIVGAEVSNKFVCWHCQIPFTVSRNARKLQMLREGLIKRPLCAQCEKRDNELATAVNQCLRIFGGLCCIKDVVAVYSDEKRAKQLFKDPYYLVRKTYKGKDTLTLRDIEGWVQDGMLRISKDGRVTTAESAFAKELEFRAAVREVRDEMRDAHRPPKIVHASEQDTSSISRRDDEGGAVKGADYWEKMRKRQE